MGRIGDWIDRRIGLAGDFNFRRERLNSYSHIAGLFLALLAVGEMLYRAAGHRDASLVLAVYGLAMVCVFASSAMYHFLKPSTAKRIFRVFDYVSIYLFIAGTYTPYAAAAGPPAGTRLLVAVWLTAAVGILLKLIFWNRFKAFHVGVFLLMGWLIVFFWKPVLGSAPQGQTLWMMIGGISYTVGVVFYSLSRRNGIFHFVWHLFVVLGTAGLYVGIRLFALPTILG